MNSVMEFNVENPQAESNSDLELTILMPCLNEAETIGICIAKAQAFLQRAGVKGEVLIADNGSTDGSRAIATNLGARVIPIPRRGYGAALGGGIEAACGRYIVMGDADDSYDFANLGRFSVSAARWCRPGDGQPVRGGISRTPCRSHRYLGNPVLSFIGRLFFEVPVGDFHCGLRGFRAEQFAA